MRKLDPGRICGNNSIQSLYWTAIFYRVFSLSFYPPMRSSLFVTRCNKVCSSKPQDPRRKDWLLVSVRRSTNFSLPSFLSNEKDFSKVSISVMMSSLFISDFTGQYFILDTFSRIRSAAPATRDCIKPSVCLIMTSSLPSICQKIWTTRGHFLYCIYLLRRSEKPSKSLFLFLWIILKLGGETLLSFPDCVPSRQITKPIVSH